jgi:hypothetical protein
MQNTCRNGEWRNIWVKTTGKILLPPRNRLVFLFNKSIDMKKCSIPLICAFIMLTFIFGNCNKNDTPPPTKTELITKASWKFRSANADGIGDVSGNIPDCYKDNINVFNSNGTGSVDEAVTICSPSSAGPFTWSFQSAETQLFISTVLFPGGSQTFTLVSLTDTELKISQTVTPPLSTPLLITFTFNH